MANLAAFLTMDSYKYVGTMEEATKQGLKICALPATKTELEIAWPDTKFHFGVDGAGSYHSLIDEWDKGRCQGISYHVFTLLCMLMQFEVTLTHHFSHILCHESTAIIYGFANLELMNMLCERDLVITKSVALENPVAWPIRSSYSAGLSYWMYEADKKYGLKVESIKEEYDAKTEQPSCNVNFSPSEDSGPDDYAKISIANLFFPFIFFGCFALVALCLQLYAARQKKQIKLGRKRPSLLDSSGLVGRNSTMFLPTNSTKFLHRRGNYGDKEDSDIPVELGNAHIRPAQKRSNRDFAQDSQIRWKENRNDSLSDYDEDDDRDEEEAEQNEEGKGSSVVTATPIGRGSWTISALTLDQEAE